MNSTAEFVPQPERGRRGIVVKRLADRVLAAVALVLLSPLLTVAAIAIRLDSRGPVFYRQARAGLGGRAFLIYKFRTMIDGADAVGLGANIAENDWRITRVGGWLRRTSMDEVPQLLNVLRGEMSLVGPRPAPVAHLAMYSTQQWRRLSVRPGITGWAQVNGRNALSWEQRIELDLWYVDHWSVGLDLRIISRTPQALLRPGDLYGPDGVTTDLGSDGGGTNTGDGTGGP